MIYSLGGFKFESSVAIDSIAKTTVYGITSQDRINNYASLYAAKKETQTITLTGKTLPSCGAKNNALEALYKLASKQVSYTLVSGSGKFIGRFAITSIVDTQSIFLPSGEFLGQSFSLTLTRDYNV
jgi:phage protein U